MGFNTKNHHCKGGDCMCVGGELRVVRDGKLILEEGAVVEDPTGLLGGGSGGPELIFDGDITFDIENNDGTKCYKSSNAVEIPIEFGAVYIVVVNSCYEVNGEIVDGNSYGVKICVGSNNGYNSPGIGAYSYQDTDANNSFHFSGNEAWYRLEGTEHFKIYKWL